MIMKKEVKRKICERYCGISCVDGSCPKANFEEYAERGMDVVRSCDECPYYRGCVDCCFSGTEYCLKKGDL